MDFDGVDDDNDTSGDDDLPSSIVVNRNDERLSHIAPSVNLDQSPASPIQDYKAEEEDPGNDHDDDEHDVSTFSSASSDSLDLNPTSSLDKLDLPGIALLKEIFPEETTNSLRKMHYKHIMLNKTSPSPVLLPVSVDTPSRTNPTKTMLPNDIGAEASREIGHNDQENDETRHKISATHQIPVADLPEDFLRLPKSVAVLRKRRKKNGNEKNNGQTYEFIKDLEMQMLEKYYSAGTNLQQIIHPSGKYVEYNTYVVDKDDRWGLGMTLQEVIEEWNPLGCTEQEYITPGAHFVMGHEPQHTVIRYGLMVIGFLPDPKKTNQSRGSRGQRCQSPAEVSGIQCNDVLIGINGAPFLLQLPLFSSSSYTADRRSDQYKIQKERIIQSIQNSPTPVVLHIRRKRDRSSIEKSFSERNITSLLDTSTIEDLERDDLCGVFDVPENVPIPTSHNVSRGSKPPLQPSVSSAFYSTKSASAPRQKPRPMPHPLSVALAHRKLIRPGEDQWRITRRLHQFTERARQCESSNSLRIFISRKGGVEKGTLAPHFNPTDLPPDMAALMVYQKDGVSGRTNALQARQSNLSDSSTSNDNDDGKNQQQLEQNDVHIQSQSYLAKISCTPSTPTLPYDSPLIPKEYLQAFYGDRQAREIRLKATLMTQSANGYETSESMWENMNDMAWIPLHGIRKGLSARIVNSFVESAGSNSNKNSNMKSRIAYTIWVYDLESGREWYAPIRYWNDFSDLREAALVSLPSNSNLHKELSILKFEKDPAIPNDSNSGWSASVFSSPSMPSPISPFQQRRRKRKNDEFDEARQTTSRSLEEFLRELLGTIYTCYPLHTSTAEIALYVQSFLGVDAGLEDRSESFLDIRTFKTPAERIEDEARQHLKRSIQRYSWRIFLLHTMKAIVKDFVDAARARGPKLHEIESMDADTKAFKSRAMDELLRIQNFLDQLVDLILDGCHDDLESIAKRREYSAIHKTLADESYWERLMR